MGLVNGKYHTSNGSLLEITGQYGGIVDLSFDRFEEGACIECQPDPYPDSDGYLVWRCNHCDGGKSQWLPGSGDGT